MYVYEGRWVSGTELQDGLGAWDDPGSCGGQDAYDNLDRDAGHEGLDTWCASRVYRLECALTLYAVPLAVLIIGRDVLLSLSAFYIRYTSLPAPVRSPHLPCIPPLTLNSRKLWRDTGTSRYRLPRCIPP